MWEKNDLGRKRSRPNCVRLILKQLSRFRNFSGWILLLANVHPKKTYQYSAPHECDSPMMMEHEQSTESSLDEERKWLESAGEAIQEPEDITITNVVYHSRQEIVVEPHDYLTISALLSVQFEVAHTFKMNLPTEFEQDIAFGIFSFLLFRGT